MLLPVWVQDFFWQIVISLAIILILFVTYRLLLIPVKKNVKKGKMKKTTSLLARKTIRSFFIIIGLAILVILWGGDLENFWISVAGVLGVVAIGFFAVWSVLSNVVAGVILLSSKAFNIDDKIEIFPEHIKGRVKNVGLMFVVLKDKKGDTFHIPNNILMQRFVKTIKDGKKNKG